MKQLHLKIFMLLIAAFAFFGNVDAQKKVIKKAVKEMNNPINCIKGGWYGASYEDNTFLVVIQQRDDNLKKKITNLTDEQKRLRVLEMLDLFEWSLKNAIMKENANFKIAYTDESYREFYKIEYSPKQIEDCIKQIRKESKLDKLERFIAALNYNRYMVEIDEGIVASNAYIKDSTVILEWIIKEKDVYYNASNNRNYIKEQDQADWNAVDKEIAHKCAELKLELCHKYIFENKSFSNIWSQEELEEYFAKNPLYGSDLIIYRMKK